MYSLLEMIEMTEPRRCNSCRTERFSLQAIMSLRGFTVCILATIILQERTEGTVHSYFALWSLSQMYADARSTFKISVVLNSNL